MKRNLTKLMAALALLVTLAIPMGVWGQASVGTTLWGETWARFSANDVPSGTQSGNGLTVYGSATVSYSVTNGGGTTKIYNENTGGGTAPELLLAKSNATWTITGIPTGQATGMSLTFKSNKTTFSLASSTTGISISGSGKSWTIEATSSVETFDLTLTNTGGSNSRIDDFVLSVTTAGGDTPQPTTYTVTYDCNGGTSGCPQNVTGLEDGDEIELADGPVKDGYDFAGWSDGSTVYDEGDTYIVHGNVTFTAQWTGGAPSLEVMYDFTSTNNFWADDTYQTHPSTGSTNNISTFYYNNDTHDAFSADGTNHYFSNGYFMLGKTGAMLTLPTFAGYKITQIIINNTNNGSTNVSVSIMSGNDVAAAAQQWSTGGSSYTYNIPNAYQTDALTITIANNYNAQITGVTVVREEINNNKVATPEFNPAGGIITEATNVTLSCATTGATIYYTLDGSTPTTSSAVYSEAIPVNVTTTIKAFAVKSGMDNSNVAEATYTREYTITLTQTEGGVISADKEQAAENETVTLTVTPSVGYTFTEWNITPSTVTVNSNGEFAMPAENVTVSATFATAQAYTITFNINGKEEMTATVTSGNSIDMTKFVADVTTPGYIFDGWYDAATGGNKIADSYQPSGDVTVYAQFGEPSTDAFTLVTSADQLEAGNLVVIAANGDKNWGMSTTQETNNRGAATLTKNNNIITFNEEDGLCVLTLGTSNNHWTFYDGDGVGGSNGYLYAASSSKNYLRTQANNDANGEWTIDVTSEGEATITAQGENTHNVLKYNSGDVLFSCYLSTSGQQTVWLYTKPAAKATRDNVEANAKVTAIDADVLVTVKANGIVYLTGANAGNETNLVVEDGGQLFMNSNVAGTMLKNIAGYGNNAGGWYFVSSPVTPNMTPADAGMITPMNGNYSTFDLYSFDYREELEWRNYWENQDMKLINGTGYLYANQDDVILHFLGNLKANNNAVEHTLYYVDGGTDNWNGWNLVGNPFTSNAQVDKAIFKLNETSDGINTTVIEAGSVVAPAEGMFVVATASNQKVTFTATTDDVTPTTTSSKHGINIDVARTGEFLDRAIVSFGDEESVTKVSLSDETTKVYFDQDEKEYAIMTSDNENELPFSFKASRNDAYTLSIDAAEFEMEYLHLIDNLTGADIDLLETPSYTFNAQTTDYAQRFTLVFKNTTGVSESTANSFAFFNGTNWTVSNEGDATLQVVDVMGRILSTQNVNGNATITLDQPTGVYMLRLVNGDNVKVQKVVVR